MARLKIHADRIIENIQIINTYMMNKGKIWSLVVKVLGNDRKVLSVLLSNAVIAELHSVAVTQVANLKLIKEINPEIRTMFIKPPNLKNASAIVKYADYSLNTSIATLKL
jgi:predicted amino acid racemase